MDAGGDEGFQFVGNGIATTCEESVDRALGNMSFEVLTKLHGLVDGSNPDSKLTEFKKALFRECLSVLDFKEKTCKSLKELMSEVTLLILTRDYSDDEGKILWKGSLKKAISDKRDAIIEARARAAAPP